MKNIIGMIFMMILFSSCEKVINLDIKENQPRIVIVGNISEDAGPYFVKISKSTSLADTSSSPTINDAAVTISDNAGNSERLLSLGNGNYSTVKIQGTPGRTYTLTVVTSDQTYQAQSTMPLRVPFDSLRVEKNTILGDVEFSLIPVYHDPSTLGNNYRFVLSVNDKLINQHFTQNDIIRNGHVNATRLEINDDDLELKSGDRVSLQMQCVDGIVGRYYTTLALMGDNGPGGGVTPINPPNNFSNGALGIFSAYTAETHTITLP